VSCLQSFFSRHWFKLVTGVIVLAVIAAIGYQQLAGKGSPYKVIKPAPAFQLENIDGKQVSLQDTNGKVRLVYFFFSTCPDVCPRTTFMLSKVQDLLAAKGEFGKSTAFHSITFDPAKDTREALKEYAGRFHADPAGWSFLRGDEAAAVKLAEAYGTTVLKDKDGNFSHYDYIYLVDAKGNLRHSYDGTDVELTADKIAADMLQLTKE
jgi:protein SCO1/2